MKKLFISLLSIFLLSTLFCNIVSAQTSTSSPISQGIVVATVNLSNAKIVTQKDRDFVISFDISNRVGAQPQVMYSVRLTKASSTSQTVFDEKVYEETLSLAENTTLNKTIEYSIPSSLSSSTYQIWVESKNQNGLPLGIALAGEVTILPNTTNTIEIVTDSCYLTKGSSTVQYLLSQGTLIEPSETLTAKCKVKSSFPTNITLTPNFITRNHTAFGDIASTTGGSIEKITLKKGTNDITLILPKAFKSQDYNLSFSFVSPNTVSNTISFNYTLAGQSGTVQNVVFDKTYYKAGETANLQIFSTQSGTSTISILVSNSEGVECAASSTKEISGFSVLNLSIPITKDCLNPKADITLSSNRNILDSNNFQVTTVVSTSTATTTTNNIVYILIVIVWVLIIGTFIYRKKNKKKHLKIRLFTFIIFFLISFFSLGISVYAVSTPILYGAGTNGDLEITLFWGMPTGTSDPYLSNFEIYRGTTSGGEVFLKEIGNVNTYMDYGLTNGVKYYYKVAAKTTYKVYRYSPQSNELSATAGIWCTGVTSCTSWGSCINGTQTCNIGGYSLIPSNCSFSPSPIPTQACFPPPPTITLNSASSTVSYNTATQIYGTMSNSSYCTLTGNGNTTAWTNPTSISTSTGNLTSNTTFILSCSGPGGTANKSLNLTANLPSPITINLISASPSLLSGSSTMITWDASGADTCTITKNGIAWSTSTPSGYKSSGNLTASTIFIAFCKNSLYSATTSASASPVVIVSPSIKIGLGANPTHVSLGGVTQINFPSLTGANTCKFTKNGALWKDWVYTWIDSCACGSHIQKVESATPSYDYYVNYDWNIAHPSGGGASVCCSTVSAGPTSPYSYTSDPITSDTTFVGICTNNYYSVAESIKVSLDVPLSVNISAASSSIASGASTMISWHATGTDSCTIKTDNSSWSTTTSAITTYVLQSSFGVQGSGDGQFNTPFTAVADSFGNVYVSDSGNNRVQKFDSSGRLLLKFGLAGTGNGQFNNPTDMAIDSSNNIYVVDKGNYRVQKFDSSGHFIWWLGYDGSTIGTHTSGRGYSGTSNGQFSNLTGLYGLSGNISIDQFSNIIVADNSRTQTFTSSGVFISSVGQNGAGIACWQASCYTWTVYDSIGNKYDVISGTSIKKYSLTTVLSGAKSSDLLATTTIFTATCTKGALSSATSTTVTILSPIIINLTALPTSVLSNGTSSISWNSFGANTCTITKSGSVNPIANALNSSISSGPITSATTFIATCTNNSGNSVSTSTIVSIKVPLKPPAPTNISAVALTASISCNQIELSWTKTPDVDYVDVYKDGMLAVPQVYFSPFTNVLSPQEAKTPHTYYVVGYSSSLSGYSASSSIVSVKANECPIVPAVVIPDTAIVTSTCSASQTGNAVGDKNIYIYKNTAWTVELSTSSVTNLLTEWSGTNIPLSIFISGSDPLTLNKMYTTVGKKDIKVVTTGKLTNKAGTAFSSTCIASTTAKLSEKILDI